MAVKTFSDSFGALCGFYYILYCLEILRGVDDSGGPFARPKDSYFIGLSGFLRNPGLVHSYLSLLVYYSRFSFFSVYTCLKLIRV